MKIYEGMFEGGIEASIKRSLVGRQEGEGESSGETQQTVEKSRAHGKVPSLAPLGDICREAMEIGMMDRLRRSGRFGESSGNRGEEERTEGGRTPTHPAETSRESSTGDKKDDAPEDGMVKEGFRAAKPPFVHGGNGE